MKKRQTKSPIKNLPVRQPGQSIRDRINTIIGEKADAWLVGSLCMVFYAVLEWFYWFSNTPRMPWVFTAMAIVVVFLAWTRLRHFRNEIRALRLGRIGEEAVGQYLEETLRPHGYHVLHDIPGEGFNLDHVVIGPSGVYCVETKTHSKPARGAAKVTYDGASILVDGLAPDRNPLVQARSGAAWLSNLLEASTGKRFRVQPVVLYPGWFVESSVQWPETWVMNEKQFPSTLLHQRCMVEDPDVHLIVYHLKRYIIARETEAGRR